MRLQSALEYLSTYGWAMIIIGVAAAVLYSIGVLNAVTYAPQECLFSAGFTCLGYTMNSMGLLNINLQQSTQDPILVNSMNCTQTGATGSLLKPNQYMTVGSNSTFVLQCYTATGAFSSTIGGIFRGTVILNYTDELTMLPGTAVGTVSVKVSRV
jgi:hypothetical protein